MVQNPRPFTATFFNWKELTTSIFQGLFITAGTFFAYQYAIILGFDEALTRTMVFTVFITANVFLTLVNRSIYYSIFTTLKYKNNMALLLIGITLSITASLLFFPPPTRFFNFETLNLSQFTSCIYIGFITVMWCELVKINTRYKAINNHLGPQSPDTNSIPIPQPVYGAVEAPSHLKVGTLI